MNPELLLTFFILCSALPTTLSRSQDQSEIRKLPSRLLSQKIIDEQTKKVEKAIIKNTFQSYHFLLQPSTKFIEFYIDPMSEEQIQGHVNIMWKHRNAFLLPNILKSEKIKLEIYENEDKILKKSFYTKAAFRFNGEQDKLYRIKISNKNQQPLVPKLITLNIENLFQQFNEIQQQEQIQTKKKLKSKKKMRSNKYLSDENESQKQEIYETTNFQSKKSRKEKQTDEEQKKVFELCMVSQRLKQFLMEMKLIINQAQTKHLAEYTIQKFIENSIQIYWQYELFQCVIVILCTIVQIFLVNRLLNSNKILV